MKRFANRFDILEFAAAKASSLEGLVLEFGVATGGTIQWLAQMLPDRLIFGFDSFQGLPEKWGHYQVGHFCCEPPKNLPTNVVLVEGWFEDTLPSFLDTHTGPIALLHLDADLYSSTTFVLDQLTDRIVAGTVIVLDEYFIVVAHEQRAFREWLIRTNRNCQHIAMAGVEQLCVVMV